MIQKPEMKATLVHTESIKEGLRGIFQCNTSFAGSAVSAVGTVSAVGAVSAVHDITTYDQ